MSDVRRYDIDENGVCTHQLDGAFVSHDDYAELLRENAFLKSEVDRLKNNCEYIDRQLDEYINGKETE